MKFMLSYEIFFFERVKLVTDCIGLVGRPPKTFGFNNCKILQFQE